MLMSLHTMTATAAVGLCGKASSGTGRWRDEVISVTKQKFTDSIARIISIINIVN